MDEHAQNNNAIYMYSTKPQGNAGYLLGSSSITQYTSVYAHAFYMWDVCYRRYTTAQIPSENLIKLYTSYRVRQ